MGNRGMSMSTGDIASALEAQQQHQQLLQRRVSAAVPDAASMWNPHSAVCHHLKRDWCGDNMTCHDYD